MVICNLFLFINFRGRVTSDILIFPSATRYFIPKTLQKVVTSWPQVRTWPS